MRLFVAIDLPSDVRVAIAARQIALQAALEDYGFRWTDATTFHVTLAFLGEVLDADLPSVQSIVKDVVAEAKAMPISVVGIGAFPVPSHPRILVAYVRSTYEMELERLGTAMQRALSGMGECRPDKRFIPHVTLARSSKPQSIERREEAFRSISPLRSVAMGSFLAEEVLLYRSHLGAGSPRHDVLARFPIGP